MNCSLEMEFWRKLRQMVLCRERDGELYQSSGFGLCEQAEFLNGREMSTIKDASEPLSQRYEHFMKVPYKLVFIEITSCIAGGKNG